MKQLIDFHTHHLKNDSSIDILIKDLSDSKIPNTYFCLGLHPWEIKNYSLEKILGKIDTLKANPYFFGLGEIGLDKMIETNLEIQNDIFCKQVDYAVKNNIKTIILHNVKTYNETLLLLKESTFKGNILLHGFNEQSSVFEQFNNYFNTYISIGLNQFKSERKLETLKTIPLEKILFETDDNKDIQINEVYQKYSDILKTDLVTLVKYHHDALKELKQN